MRQQQLCAMLLDKKDYNSCIVGEASWCLQSYRIIAELDLKNPWVTTGTAVAGWHWSWCCH